MSENQERPIGATLYVPATKENIAHVRDGGIPGLRSMVICLEDAVRDDEVEKAMRNLFDELNRERAHEGGPITYIRPRSMEMMRHILMMPGIAAIRGVVIPKAHAETIPEWMEILRDTDMSFMPTLETVHIWQPSEIMRIRDQISTHASRVDMVRIGGNDLLSTIGARRSRHRTLYHGPLGSIVPGIVGAFAQIGIPVSSPVLEHYLNDDLLAEEIDLDIEHGISNKTAIHPHQVHQINTHYAVTMAELAEARAILDENVSAVFGSRGSMCEPRTHAAWARTIINRHEHFGITPDVRIAQAV